MEAMSKQGSERLEKVALGGGEVHEREFDLEEGEFLHLLVEQVGIDVTLRLLDPRGREILRRDRPTGRHGPEEAVLIASEKGRYRCRVEAPARAVAPGQCLFRVLAKRPARERDRKLVQADEIHEEARRLAEGDLASAVEKFEQAMALSASLELDGWEALAAHGLCSAHLAAGDLAAATAACDRAVDLYREGGEPHMLSFLLDRAGWLRLRSGRPQEALALFSEALALGERLGEERRTGAVLAHVGNAYQALGRATEALALFEDAVARNDAEARAVTEAAILTDWGSALLALGRAGEAREKYSAALGTYRRLDRQKQAAIALNGMVEAAVQLGDFETAEADLGESIEGLRAAGAGRDLAGALKTLGFLRRKRGDFAAARPAYEEALKESRAVGDPHTEAVVRLELGYVHVLDGQPRQGLELLDEARRSFERIGDRQGEAAARVRGAEAQRDLGELDAAWKRIRPVLDLMGVTEATGGPSADERDGGAPLPVRSDYCEIARDLLEKRGETGVEAEALRRALEGAIERSRRAGEREERAGAGRRRTWSSLTEGGDMDRKSETEKPRKSYRSIEDPQGDDQPVNISRSDLPGGGDGEEGGLSREQRLEILERVRRVQQRRARDLAPGAGANGAAGEESE